LPRAAEKYGDQRVKVALRKAQRHRSAKALLPGSASLASFFVRLGSKSSLSRHPLHANKLLQA